MSKIKIAVFIILVLIVYKVFIAIKNFEVGVGKRVAEIQKIDIEREDEVIGLLMYLDGSNGLELVEHLLVENRSKCIQMKEIAEETSNAYYECEKIKAIIKEKKILKVIEKIEIL